MNEKSAPVMFIPMDDKHRPVTLGDLQTVAQMLKDQIVKELRLMLTGQPAKPVKQWLKNKAVRDMLGISSGTLQTLRDNGVLPFSRIGRQFYYDPADIDQVIELRKQKKRHAA